MEKISKKYVQDFLDGKLVVTVYVNRRREMVETLPHFTPKGQELFIESWKWENLKNMARKTILCATSTRATDTKLS